MSSGLDVLVMQDIAKHAHVAVEVVNQVYLRTLAEMQTTARIHDFVPLLAMKRVRQLFLHPVPHMKEKPAKPSAPEPAALRATSLALP